MAGLPALARGALSALGGVLLALGLPPYGLWPLAFIGLPLFLVLLETGRQASWRSGFGLGWLFGLGYFTLALHWIGYAFFVEADTLPGFLQGWVSINPLTHVVGTVRGLMLEFVLVRAVDVEAAV